MFSIFHLYLIKQQSKAMLVVHKKKVEMKLNDPRLNELNCWALYNIPTDASYVYKCIGNIAKRFEETYLTNFITYAQEGK